MTTLEKLTAQLDARYRELGDATNGASDGTLARDEIRILTRAVADFIDELRSDVRSLELRITTLEGSMKYRESEINQLTRELRSLQGDVARYAR